MYRSLFIILFSVFMLNAYAEDAVPVNSFTLNTNAFLDQGVLPVLYTCDGKDLSPQLVWSGAPDKTQTYAFILSDPSAPKGTFYHWVLYNIPKTITTLPQGDEKLPTGLTVGKNGTGKPGYKGPCPPKESAHTYYFTLYAIDEKLPLPASADAQTLLNAMKNHVVGKAELTAVYSRWIG